MPNVFDALKPVLIEKAKAEEREGGERERRGMEYAIVRPGGLKSEPGDGHPVFTEDKSICGAIHREDVADLVIKCVLKAKTNGKVLSAVDRRNCWSNRTLPPSKCDIR